MKKAILVLVAIATVVSAGWFFVPGAYWTPQDGGIGFLYVQGEYPKVGWTADGRYSFDGDYWLDTELRTRFIGEQTDLRIEYSRDSLEDDWRKRSGDDETIGGYIVTEYSAYLRQHFNAGKANKFSLFAGLRHGDYESPYSANILSEDQDTIEETLFADAVDIGLEFSIDSRDDPENPQTAYYFGIKLGGLIFPGSDKPDFDYIDPMQLTDPDRKWPPSGSGYIELDQRFFGKLQMDEVPFPMILALRIGGGHHVTEVPHLVAFKAGVDDFLRGVDTRHLMGTSYYIMSGELRLQLWEESITPWILLHWLIPGYENPRPILEIVPFMEYGKVFGTYVRDDSQQMTIGAGLHWVFTDYTVLRWDVGYWPNGKTWSAYLSFEPSI